MSLFSQRMGLKPAKKAIQLKALDEEARNRLWSVLVKIFDLFWVERADTYRVLRPYKFRINAITEQYWTDYFNWASDTKPDHDACVRHFREYFFKADWNEALDFIEFATQVVTEDIEADLPRIFNSALERESCAYRFISGVLTEVTSETEITAIDDAIKDSTPEVSRHLQNSLKLLSDRKNPDPRNSIKESVSAIEAAARVTSGKSEATLSDAVKHINKGEVLHPALVKMILSLYGYAGDEGGVRHANKPTAKEVSSDEARLILVVSAGLCSYLSAKQAN